MCRYVDVNVVRIEWMDIMTMIQKATTTYTILKKCCNEAMAYVFYFFEQHSYETEAAKWGEKAYRGSYIITVHVMTTCVITYAVMYNRRWKLLT